MPAPYKIIKPKTKKVPILVSVPHCGTSFPRTIKSRYHTKLAANPDDTDFFVNRLYDFVGEMGITMIYATYSRWVIDLNRSPDNQSLYNDGRIITALTPTTDFMGQPIYKQTQFEPNQVEIERRKQLYFHPYYQKISALLNDLKKEFGQVLLWDAHSIRQIVPSIQAAPFPDMILGNNEGITADAKLIQSTLNGLKTSTKNVAHNHPFKGGHITRSFGDPANGIHALQLEMVKRLYMDDTETQYHKKRAKAIRKVLKHTFGLLIKDILA